MKRIVIHCSDTPEGRFHNAADIDRWHKAKGWSGIGYHYVILLDGTVEEGRPEHKKGAHAYGFNKDSIGICYIGGKTKDKKSAKDTRTEEQKCELENLLRVLHEKYPEAEIMGHRDLSPDKDGDGVVEEEEWMKQCPSFDVKEWLEEIKFYL